MDHTTQLLPNRILYGVPVIHQNTILGNLTYSQAFPTGGAIQVAWNNNRQTTNSPNNTLNPQLNSYFEFYANQQLLAGFGLGPNLRFLRIAKTNQKVSDIAFRAQLIATVTQICDLYWDLVNAYDNEQVGERSVAFATETLNTARKQLALQAIPEMDVLKAEADLATRQQDLTVARTNLELQELYMKNAITPLARRSRVAGDAGGARRPHRHPGPAGYGAGAGYDCRCAQESHRAAGVEPGS